MSSIFCNEKPLEWGVIFEKLFSNDFKFPLILNSGEFDVELCSECEAISIVALLKAHGM